MSVKVGSARIDEYGKAYGGKAGDQTGREVSTQDWYLHAKGWILLRARDPEVREKIARCMQAACDNPHIGYDQYQRDTLYNEAKRFGFDVSLVTKDVECDCSSLVRVCCAYAGILVNSFRTTNEASVLMATGQFDKYTDDMHCRKSTYLLRGDILVTKTQGHTVVVLSDGENAAEEKGNIALGDRVLSKGDGGSDVRELQELLNKLGASLSVDGIFGTKTEAAVKAFQKKAGLQQDGKYGPLSHAALIAAIAETEIVHRVTIHSPDGPVNVHSGNSTDYPVICTVDPDTVLEHIATAFNGWYAVKISDRVGWVAGEHGTAE